MRLNGFLEAMANSLRKINTILFTYGCRSYRMIFGIVSVSIISLGVFHEMFFYFTVAF